MNTPLENMADQVMQSRFAIRAVLFSALNPEQQLAYMLERLVEHEKGHLALLNAMLPLTQSCVEWRKTKEGLAWAKQQEQKRAAKAATDHSQQG